MGSCKQETFPADIPKLYLLKTKHCYRSFGCHTTWRHYRITHISKDAKGKSTLFVHWSYMFPITQYSSITLA